MRKPRDSMAWYQLETHLSKRYFQKKADLKQAELLFQYLPVSPKKKLSINLNLSKYRAADQTENFRFVKVVQCTAANQSEAAMEALTVSYDFVNTACIEIHEQDFFTKALQCFINSFEEKKVASIPLQLMKF